MVLRKADGWRAHAISPSAVSKLMRRLFGTTTFRSAADLRATLEMASLLFRIAERSGGGVRIARSVADIRAAKAAGAHAPVLHIEGCEALDGDLRMLDVLYAAGLRTLGPVWSRSNIFGHGVPFRFPSSPDTGDGLTDFGQALIRRCNEMRVLIDLSHINEKGFWDIAKLSSAPLVATHSNAHALCPASRNLTDKQLAAIQETGWSRRLNYAVSSCARMAGAMTPSIPLSITRIDQHLGEMASVGQTSTEP